MAKKMCPLDGCQTKKGLCIHEKMMIGGGLALLVAVFVFLGMGV